MLRILGDFIKLNEEMSSGTEEMEAEVNAGGKAGLQEFRYALQKFRKDCENFATIAKILQSLRKFRYAQFFAKLAKFRYIAKVIVHSENLYFRYALYFRYDSKIHCIAKILPLCFGSKRPRFV